MREIHTQNSYITALIVRDKWHRPQKMAVFHEYRPVDSKKGGMAVIVKKDADEV